MRANVCHQLVSWSKAGQPEPAVVDQVTGVGSNSNAWAQSQRETWGNRGYSVKRAMSKQHAVVQLRRSPSGACIPEDAMPGSVMGEGCSWQQLICGLGRSS